MVTTDDICVVVLFHVKRPISTISFRDKGSHMEPGRLSSSVQIFETPVPYERISYRHACGLERMVVNRQGFLATAD